MSTSTQLDRLPPTTTAYLIATAIVAGLTGYFIGQGSSIGLFSSESRKNWSNSSKAKGSRGFSYESENSESDSADDDEDEDDGGEIATFKDNTDEVKLVLVVRTDLGMTKGKIAAQCSHATLACYKYFIANAPESPILRRWERGGQAKIALQVKSEDELALLQAQAISLKLCARMVHDAGRTQIPSGSRTVLGILGPKCMVDTVTGGLKLL